MQGDSAQSTSTTKHPRHQAVNRLGACMSGHRVSAFSITPMQPTLFSTFAARLRDGLAMFRGIQGIQGIQGRPHVMRPLPKSSPFCTYHAIGHALNHSAGGTVAHITAVTAQDVPSERQDGRLIEGTRIHPEPVSPTALFNNDRPWGSRSCILAACMYALPSATWP